MGSVDKVLKDLNFEHLNFFPCTKNYVLYKIKAPHCYVTCQIANKCLY